MANVSNLLGRGKGGRGGGKGGRGGGKWGREGRKGGRRWGLGGKDKEKVRFIHWKPVHQELFFLLTFGLSIPMYSCLASTSLLNFS